MKNIAAAALIMVAIPQAAHASSVSEYLARADKLKAAGMFAMFSADSRALQSELRAAFKTYRAEQRAAMAKGSKALGCPPDKISLDGIEFVNALRMLIPAAQQATTSFQSGVNAYAQRRFPCPG